MRELTLTPAGAPTIETHAIDDVRISLCGGRDAVVSGNTFKHRLALTNAGFTYSPRAKQWTGTREAVAILTLEGKKFADLFGLKLVEVNTNGIPHLVAEFTR